MFNIFMRLEYFFFKSKATGFLYRLVIISLKVYPHWTLLSIYQLPTRYYDNISAFSFRKIISYSFAIRMLDRNVNNFSQSRAYAEFQVPVGTDLAKAGNNFIPVKSYICVGWNLSSWSNINDKEIKYMRSKLNNLALLIYPVKVIKLNDLSYLVYLSYSWSLC